MGVLRTKNDIRAEVVEGYIRKRLVCHAVEATSGGTVVDMAS
jgi:hypothetical protein